MKQGILTTLITALAFVPHAFAKTSSSETPIHFAKGSLCGSFDGNVAGHKFTLQLDKNQTLYIDIASSKPIIPKVADPHGKSLSISYEYPSGTLAYRTNARGKYTVQFDPDDAQYPFAKIKFCDY